MLCDLKNASNAALLGRVLGNKRLGTKMLSQAKGSVSAVLNEPRPQYGDLEQAWVKLQAARELVRRSLAESLREQPVLSSPKTVRDYLRLTLSGLEHELFMALFLDAQNRLIAAAEMFRGTLTQTSVYPREVVKAALKWNAAAVILAHNHPSGIAEFSRADEALTETLKAALAMVDVKILDHFLVAKESVVSFAERGLI